MVPSDLSGMLPCSGVSACAIISSLTLSMNVVLHSLQLQALLGATTLIKHSVVSMFALMILGVGLAYCQDFPSKTIRIITAEPGGGGDFTARMIAQTLTTSAGWQTIVDNRPSGLTSETVARAAPDGYTLLVNGTGFLLLPLMKDNITYDAVKDFTIVSMLTRSPNVLVIHPSVPANSVKELIALAKAKPGTLNYSSGAAGGINHLAPELFKAMAGVNIVRIPYKGTGPAFNALIAGEVQVMFITAAGIAPYVKSGRVKALAVTTAEPTPLAPGLPTLSASGVPGYEAASLLGAWASGGTPPEIVSRLNQEIVRVLNRPEVKQKFLDSGVETISMSPEESAATIRAEVARMGKLIKDVGIRAE